jgi:DNA-binding NarL/FixJ family response regulator
MHVESAREKGPGPGEATSGDAVAGESLCVLVLAGDAAERTRLAAQIGATRGLSCHTGDASAGVDPSRIAPDVVLLVLGPGDQDGETLVRDAVERWKPAPLLVLSESADRDVDRALVRRGARGVVHRNREAEQLGTAIRKVSDGEIWLSRACLSRLIDDMAASAGPVAHPRAGGTLGSLTDREREVVAHIAEGMHNRAISQKLGITETTVRHHLPAIYGKFGVADRLELAVFALRQRGGPRGRR